MSNFARDPSYGSALNQSTNLRQITTVGATAAGTLPPVLASAGMWTFSTGSFVAPASVVKAAELELRQQVVWMLYRNMQVVRIFLHSIISEMQA